MERFIFSEERTGFYKGNEKKEKRLIET